ncbi:TNF receptor-associated factor 1-like, partial [Hyla sarda]|uniref:TNF receptor-associated factor 1-like n=1 Tax=Hyla sarda TaxID=327740 RepID=UPI0024C4068D
MTSRAGVGEISDGAERVSPPPPRICDHRPGNRSLYCKCGHILRRALQSLCGHRYSLEISGDTLVCQDHQLAMIRGPAGCGRSDQRRDLADHLDGDCSVCPGCSQTISRNQSQKHNCEKTICKDPTKGKNHQGGAMDCPYTSLGCTYRGSRDKMKEHEKSAAAFHLSLVLTILRQIQSGRPAAAVTENGFGAYNGDVIKLPSILHNGESVYEEIAADCGHHYGAMMTSDLTSRICALENRIQVTENIITVMNREIDSYSAKLTAAQEQIDQEHRKVRACEAK